MIVNKLLNYNSSKYSDDKMDIKEIDKDFTTLFNALQQRLRFGSGTTGGGGENFGGTWIRVVTSGTSEVAVPHNLGSAPMAFIVMSQRQAGSLYAEPQGLGINTAWTSGTSYFKSNTAGTYTVFLLERGGT